MKKKQYEYVSEELKEDFLRKVTELKNIGIGKTRISNAMGYCEAYIQGTIARLKKGGKLKKTTYDEFIVVYNNRDKNFMDSRRAVKIIERISVEKRKSITKITKEIGVAQSNFSAWKNQETLYLVRTTINKIMNYVEKENIDIDDIISPKKETATLNKKGKEVTEMKENDTMIQELIERMVKEELAKKEKELEKQYSEKLKQVEKELKLLKEEVDFFGDRQEMVFKFNLNKDLVEFLGFKKALLLTFIQDYNKPINSSNTGDCPVLWSVFPYKNIVNEGEFKNIFYLLRNNKYVNKNAEGVLKIDNNRLNEEYKKELREK